jgi:hypothetical protein
MATKHCLFFRLFVSSVLVVFTIPQFMMAAGQSSSSKIDLSTASLSSNADFYVATNGNDSWPGTLAQPFLTVDRARLAVQALKSSVSGRTITVLLRNGHYYLTSTLTFTSADSGTSNTSILYASYPGETAVISGGMVLSNWTVNTDGTWEITLPSGTYFSQLWVNGNRCFRPRTTPNGYLYFSGEYSTTGSTTTVNQFSYATPPSGGVPSTMANLADVDVIVFEAWDVAHMRISSVNTSIKRITTTSALPKNAIYQGFIPNHHFLLENVKEATKQPGQFYLDRPTGVLTYKPRSGETPTNTLVIAPRLQQVLTASGLSNVRFQGLTFAHSDYPVPGGGYNGGQADASLPATVSLTNSTNVVFEADTITHTGAYGIEFKQSGAVESTSGYLAQFRDGLVFDTGAGGIRIGKQVTSCNTDSDVPQQIYVGNNLITGGGRVFPVGYGILVGDAHHILIEHNEISDFYNVGVGVGFNWNYGCNRAHDNVVQYNSIHNLGQGVTSDFGAVYYLSGLNTGNKIVNNKVHDMASDPAGYGGWGLYTDAGAMGVSIENNLVYRTTDASLHVNHAPTAPPSGTPPNLFKNNILAYGNNGAMARHNDTTFLSFQFENNIFYYDHPAIQYGYWYCQGRTICTNYFQFDDNLYFKKNVSGGKPSTPFFKTSYSAANTVEQPPVSWLTFQQWQSQGEDVHSLFSNPLFANPTPGIDNYTLSASSPAFGQGFVAFDPSQAGRLSTASLQAPVVYSAYPSLTNGVIVLSPATNGTYSNPVHFNAYAVGSGNIYRLRIYVDSVSTYTVNSGYLSTSLTLSPGTRSVLVQAWDVNGNVYKTTRTLLVK